MLLAIECLSTYLFCFGIVLFLTVDLYIVVFSRVERIEILLHYCIMLLTDMYTPIYTQAYTVSKCLI